MQFFAMPCATNVLTKILKKINPWIKKTKRGSNATRRKSYDVSDQWHTRPFHSFTHQPWGATKLFPQNQEQCIIVGKTRLNKTLCDQRKKKLITLPQSRRRLGPSLRRHDVSSLPHTHSFASMDNSCVLTSFFQFHFFTLVFSPPNLSDGRKRSNWR